MTEKVVIKGQWWLPDTPNNRVSGTLTYTPHESICLELIGSLQGEDLVSIMSLNSVPIIFGEASNSHKITLFGNVKSITNNFACSFSLSSYKCNLLIDGFHLKDSNELHRYEVQARFRGLEYWCYPRMLETKLTDTSVTYKVKDTRYKIVKNVTLGDRLSLSLRWGIELRASVLQLSPNCSQYTSFFLNYKHKVTFNSIWKEINQIEDFLSFASLQEIECEGMTISYGKSSANIYFLTSKPQQEIKPTHNFLFGYSEIEDVYTTMIQKWFLNDEEIRPIRSHLIKAIRKKSYFDSTDFLIVIYALEGYALRFIDDKLNFTNAINSIIEQYKDIEIISKMTFDVDILRNSRNYYSHFMPEDNRKHYTEIELLHETKKLKKLLYCCMLSFSGIDNERINKLIK